MSKKNTGDGFGLDQVAIDGINWGLALSRITFDLRSDFIYAPHLSAIYRDAGEAVISLVKKGLQSGHFSFGLPLTIEVPKSYRIRVNTNPMRLGPNYSRPGSILLPLDRVFYQALADEAANVVDTNTDKGRSFSHRLAEPGGPAMFLPTRTCWSGLQKAMKTLSEKKTSKYVVRLDVANFFGSINQHTLINLLRDAGYNKPLSDRLEILLTGFAGERNSRGILQGVAPSDLFGNFYLSPIDLFFKENGVDSARYVDDLYLFVDSVDSADRILRLLIQELRSYDLSLNEAKSSILVKSALVSEEPDLEALFEEAIDEISDQVEDDDFDMDYGFQSEWSDNDDENDQDKEIHLKATMLLFDALSEYSGQEETIERFCLPLFTKASSNYAVEHVKESFKRRPSMSQIYCSYLAEFIDDETVRAFLVGLLVDPSLYDWQKMWVLAALLRAKSAQADAVEAAWATAKDPSRHDALRAVAAIYVGRFGSLARRKSLNSMYKTVSTYIQAAIYYSSQYWPAAERKTARASYSSHSQLNELLTIAMSK